MSIETVLNNCLQTCEESKRDILLKDIAKEMARFEKIVKTSWSASCSNFLKAYKLDKNAIFEREKATLIHKHLTILIDLYDYNLKEKT